jgi:divalent metal cation (Fe/Co/Zn/Cd) transporter
MTKGRPELRPVPNTCSESCGCHTADLPVLTLAVSERRRLLRRALGLEYLTVGWNIMEGLVSLIAALGANSVALLGFGIDSFVETASGLILLWRLHAEGALRDPAAIERLDRRARRLVGGSLFVLAGYVGFEATLALYQNERPSQTVIGVIITSLSLIVMWFLARAKRGVARAIESRAMEADSFQTSACWWLSLITLSGLGLNMWLGWWWADPLAALVLVGFIAYEGWQAYQGKECTC